MSNTLNRSDSKMNSQFRRRPLSQDSTCPSLSSISKLFDPCSSDLLPLNPPTLVTPNSATSVKLFPVFPHLHISTPSAMLDASFSNSRFSLIPPIPSSPLYSPSKSSLSPESFSLRTPIPAFHLDQACHLGPPLEREISRAA